MNARYKIALIYAVTVVISAAALTLAIVLPAQAQTIGLHTISIHGRAQYERTHEGGDSTFHNYNNNNFGAYYIAENGVTVGAYRNSYFKNTFYAGYTLSSPEFHGLSAVVTAGVATGYQRLHGVGVLRLMIAPGLRAQIGEIGMRWTITPGKHGAFQHFSLEYKL